MPTPKKIDPKNLTPIQAPTKIDPSTLTAIGDDDNTDDRNALQKGFDKLTAPESYGTKHTGNPVADAGITTLSNLSAGAIGLASPFVHPLETAKTMAEMMAAGMGNSQAGNDVGQKLIAPFIPHPDESGKQYAQRLAGTGVTMLPQLALSEMAPEAGELTGKATKPLVKPIVNTIGKIGRVATNPKVITPTIMAATAIANPHISSLLPMAGEMIGGTLFSKFGDTFQPASSMGPDFSLLNRMSKMGEPEPEWAQIRPFGEDGPSPLAQSQQKAATNQYNNAANNIIRKYSTTDTGILKNKLVKLDNNYNNAITNDYKTLQNLQSIPNKVSSPYFRLAPLDITNQDKEQNTEE